MQAFHATGPGDGHTGGVVREVWRWGKTNSRFGL